MKHTYIHTMSSCTYRFIPSSLIDLPEQRTYELRMRQQPQRAKMSVINERDRRPIEPPPILQVHWHHCSPDDTKKSLQCPFYFMVANLISADSEELLSTQDYLAGSTVSSLYRLRDIDDSDGGFFVFGDLYCKKQGHYRLQFNLFEIVEGNVQNRQVITSEPFRTYMPKHYPGPVEATFLSRSFSDQGVKMRIRKEHRLNSNSARKRKLDVQALMDSQPAPKPFNSISTSTGTTAMNHYYHPPIRSLNSMQSIKTEPVKIAPASYHHHSEYQQQQEKQQCQHQQSMVYNAPPIDERNNYAHHHHYAMPIPSTSTPLPIYDHPSPSPPQSAQGSCRDDFPMTLLDEYHLQQQQQYQYQSPSCASSSSLSSVSSTNSPASSHDHHPHSHHDHHPVTPPYYSSDNDSPSLQHHVWGERLPPLKAVMSGMTSRSTPLVLPCPFDQI
ncbi:unnamed protein product [Absidia cylindrospora]